MGVDLFLVERNRSTDDVLDADRRAGGGGFEDRVRTGEIGEALGRAGLGVSARVDGVDEVEQFEGERVLEAGREVRLAQIRIAVDAQQVAGSSDAPSSPKTTSPLMQPALP